MKLVQTLAREIVLFFDKEELNQEEINQVREKIAKLEKSLTTLSSLRNRNRREREEAEVMLEELIKIKEWFESNITTTTKAGV